MNRCECHECTQARWKMTLAEAPFQTVTLSPYHKVANRQAHWTLKEFANNEGRWTTEDMIKNPSGYSQTLEESAKNGNS